MKKYSMSLPVAHITKNLHITRQAIHKLIKNLTSKEIVECIKWMIIKMKRCIALTHIGQECHRLYTEIHSHIERQITESIGDELTKTLKNMLQSDWGIE